MPEKTRFDEEPDPARSRLPSRAPVREADPQETAENVGLCHVSDDQPGIARRKRGRGFSFVGPDGEAIRDRRVLNRIRTLAIPPAWTGVWICAKANGHLQATGRDARGRKQYRYHPLFREVRESTKFDHMLDFAAALPAIRERIGQDMTRPGLPREKVLAAIVHLLEETMIRVGNPDYAKQNGSYGLTTLRNRHVTIEGSELRFRFTGKSGRPWRLKIRDRRIARIVKTAQELPGQHLFQYIDDEDSPREVTSGDINAYLREIAGRDVTAKDFRTWNGTVLAMVALARCAGTDNEAVARRAMRSVVEDVAARLGNTPAICRKCYIHPEVLEGWLDRSLRHEIVAAMAAKARDAAGLRAEEASVLRFLQKRLSQTCDLT